MSAPHDPAALSVHLPSVPPRGARIAVRASGADLGFREAGFPEPNFAVASPIRLSGRLEPLDSGGFRLRARFAGGLRLDCVRCLDAVDFEVVEALDLVWLPAVSGPEAASDGGERALDASDMNVSFYEEDRLDLRGAIWEQIHLALPAKPLCSSRCRGLCPECGADRNRRVCGCAEDASGAADRPLAALRSLAGAAAAPARPPGR